MGEEDCLPTVEESTEPPIRAQHNGTYHGPTPAGRCATSTAHLAANGDAAVPPLLTAAHTLSATQVADALGVDVQYDCSCFLVFSIEHHIPLLPW
jgi:Na+-exporting ATPase